MSFIKFQSVPITGMSFVSSIGSSIDEISVNLGQQKRGLNFNHRFQDLIKSPLGESAFDTENRFPVEDVLTNQVYYSISKISKETKVFERYKPNEIGLFFGTSTAETFPLLDKINRMFLNNSSSLLPYLTNKDCHGYLVKEMVKNFPIHGFNVTFTTACSSAATAIMEGFYAINSGLVKACFVGGFDILNPLTICGFNSLQIIDNDFCVPFAKKRKGINLSEGGGLFVLEKNETSFNPNYGYIKGVGGANDAYHMTRPDPDGHGAELSMSRALKCAQLNPNEIDYINAHGTGTQANDSSEANAISRLFAQETPISSTKSFHGHALGGSAAIELAVLIAALQKQKIWDGIFDNYEYEDSILNANNKVIKNSINSVMSNSFGFGGSNVSIIICRENS